MPNVLNFSQWLERLGMKRLDEPEIVHAVQPVQVVSDVSALVSPILPPTAATGGRIIGDAAAARFNTLEFHCRAAGGAAVEFRFIPETTQAVRWRIAIVTETLTDLLSPALQQLTPDTPVQSTVRIGRAAAAIGNTVPVQNTTGNIERIWEIFVPPGRRLYVTSSQTGSTHHIHMNILFSEFTAGARQA